MTPHSTPLTEPRTLNRREFVRTLSEAAMGTSLLAAAFTGCALTPTQKAEAADALVDKMGKMKKRTLSKRVGGIKVAPIAICQDWPQELYAPALAVGMNFVHKAGYWNEMPEAFKNLPRESYYTDITVDSTPNNPDDEDGAYRQVTDSLKKNNLRYYDFMRAHYGWKSVKEYQEKRGTYRAFQRLKKEGKVKYFGASQHDWVPYPEIIDAEIAEGLVDHIQFFYSYASPAEVRAITEKATNAGIAMNAMKVFAQGHDKMRDDKTKQAELKAPDMIGRACLREALALKTKAGKPLLGFCVTALRNMSMFEENVGAVTAKVAALDGFTALA